MRSPSSGCSRWVPRSNSRLKSGPARDNIRAFKSLQPKPHPLTHPTPTFPQITGVRERPPAARHRARGGHRLLPLPPQALPGPRSQLVGQIRTREATDENHGWTRGDVTHLPSTTPPGAHARVEARQRTPRERAPRHSWRRRRQRAQAVGAIQKRRRPEFGSSIRAPVDVRG